MSGELSGGELGSLQLDTKTGSAEMKMGQLKLEGTIAKLKNPFLVVTTAKSSCSGDENTMATDEQPSPNLPGAAHSRELDAVAIVRNKIIFKSRPIPLSLPQPLAV